MAVQDRNMAARAATARRILNLGGGAASIVASATALRKIVWYIGSGVIERFSVRVFSKANNDNTVTITPTINGTAISGGALAITAVAAPQELTVVLASKIVPGDVLAFNTGAFAGTAPAFNYMDILFYIRTGGYVVDPDTE